MPVANDDSEIIIRHVRNSIHCISEYLQNYQREVWNLISYFKAFNINSNPRLQNQKVDLLENVASKLIPFENLSPTLFLVEFVSRTSIPDNIVNGCIFYDDV